MNAQALGTLLLAGGAVAVVVWLVNKIGRALTAVLEALATVAMVLVALWLLVKTVYVVGKAAVTYWRTTLGGIFLGAWLWWGWLPVTCSLFAVAVGLPVWRWRHRLSFETWAGRRLRSWWQRWAVYARKLPGWLRACGLTVLDADRPIVVTANPWTRTGSSPGTRAACLVPGADKETPEERPVLSVEQVFKIADAMPPRLRALVLLAAFASPAVG